MIIMKYNNNNSNEKEYNKKRRGGKKGKEKNPQKPPVMHNAIAHHLLTDARAAIRPSQPTPPCLCTGHDVPWYGISFWLVRVSCPGCALSQLLAHLLAGRAWETEKSVA